MVRLQSLSDRLRAGFFVLCALGGLPLLAAACSSSPSPAAAPTTTTTSHSTSHSTQHPPTTATSHPTQHGQTTTPTVMINGHSYAVPTNGKKPIDAAVDSSGQIVLTDKGFVPQEEIAGLKQTITWTNLSSNPVTISFSHMPGTTPHQLPVGGTFTYSSPTLINFEYVSSSGFQANVSIGAFAP
jgi:hypothetical protein